MSVRTSRADKNVLSWSGDTVMWYMGTIAPQPCSQVPAEVLPDDPREWDSTLKVSGVGPPINGGVWVSHIIAGQCRENVLDINHSNGVYIDGVFGRAGETGEQVVTIKGGSRNVRLRGVIQSNGTRATITLGQWSDQSTELSRDIDLSGLYRVDGEPITVIMARVDRSSVKLPPKVKLLWWKSLAYTAYWWLKLAAVKAGLFR